MTIENQCCTFEQAKILKELGVAVNSICIWYKSSVGPCLLYRVEDNTVEKGCNAYTVAELGVMLPDDTRTYRYFERWSAYTPTEGTLQLFTFDEDKSEAQCRAAMLIHLIENKLITVEEINTRLMAG